MGYKSLHAFNLDIEDMREIQIQLSNQIQETRLNSSIKYIAGFDISYHQDLAVGVIAVFDSQKKEIVETVNHKDSAKFDYKAGFLAFRELPIFLETWKKLEKDPDIVVVDAHGKIHPRRLGFASHLSFFIDKPTFGIAKNPFVGEYKQPLKEFGNFEYVRDNDEILGVALITKENTKPVFVSIGNRITLDECIDITLRFCDHKSRIPLLTRIPDQNSRGLLRKLK